MKKLFLIFIMIGAIAFASQAQNSSVRASDKQKSSQDKVKTETPEQKAQASVDKLDKTVTLTEDQKKQVYNLALIRSKKVDEINAKYKGQDDKKDVANTEVKTARKEYRESVKKILTADQIKKMETEEKANKGKGEGEHAK